MSNVRNGTESLKSCIVQYLLTDVVQTAKMKQLIFVEFRNITLANVPNIGIHSHSCHFTVKVCNTLKYCAITEI